MPNRLSRISVAAAAALLGALACAGCSSAPGIETRAGVRYPERPLRTPAPLDVQVFMRENQKAIALTNTTAERFGPSRLWLNGWFRRDIEALEIGETLELPLTSFRDVFGDRMRGGGFFATQAPERIVLAELETGGELRRLVFVGQAAD